MTEEQSRFDFQAHQLQTALDFLREGFQVISREWRYLYVNTAVVRHGLRPREELLGRTMQECYPGIEDTPMFARLEQCMRERVSTRFENEFQYPDGTQAWFELRIEPCDDGIIVLSLDVSERKQMEKVLRQGHKLRALGQMAGSISHDLNNILNPIGLHVQLLRESLQRGVREPDLDETLGIIEAAVRTGADTVERLRSFSRQEPECPAEPTDPTQMTDLALQICLPRVRERCTVALRRESASTPRVQVRPSELVSAVVNLVMNAVEAIPDEGTITLRTGSDALVWVEVADDGRGMTPELEKRVLEPFFTTKADGTGLGLAMVYAFVQRHGGRLDIDTAPGRGTRVRMSFPASDAGPMTAEVAVPMPRRPVGRLLVVDDEPATRLVLETVLEEEGFTVETAATAEDALAKASAFRPDVMLADYQLPDMNGVALSRRLRESRRDLPILIMSGFDETHGEMAALLREPRTEHI